MIATPRMGSATGAPPPSAWRRPVVSLLLALSVGAQVAVPAHAVDEKDAIEKKIDDAGDALEDANAAVRQAAAALQRAQSLLPPAQKRLDGARARESEARAASEAATAAYQQAAAEHEAAQQRLAQIQAEYEGLRSSAGDFARRAYQMGPFAEVEMVLDATDPTDLTDRLASIRSVSKANNAALGAMAANRADESYTQLRMEALAALAREQKALAERKLAEAEAARAEAQAAKEAIDSLIASRDAAMSVASAQRASVAGQYQALRVEQRRIAKEAQKAAELARRAAESSGVVWSSPDGFEWPITRARLTQGSGPRIHPVYGYLSCHTGVDVKGADGTPIHAVQSGVVAVVDYGGPYGLHMIIAHGDDISSFYAHMSRVQADPGEIVKKGDVIGYVGSTGWVTGPHLHFEIHVDGEPYNPLGWFGQSKAPIFC